MTPLEFPLLVTEDRSLPTYHPQDTPNYYLSSQMVQDVISRIEAETDEAKAVTALIEQHETAHRRELTGEAESGDAQKALNEAVDKFKIKFGKLPFEVKTYRLFYNIVNGQQ